MQKIQPVILSGGSGSRLWPLSRGLHPKQFMDLNGDTLFARTVARAAALENSLAPIVICNERHRFFVAAALQGREGPEAIALHGQATILLEPEGRDTAPAIAVSALAALAAVRKSGEEAPEQSRPGEEKVCDPLLLVLSSDHIIAPQEAFADAVRNAAAGAAAGRLVVFGVPPTRAETGFGYIRKGRELLPGVFAVDSFVEKPDAQKAQSLLSGGEVAWNSGIFAFRASVYLEELALHAPALHAACLAIWESARPDLDFTRFSPAAFAACPSQSVDYAVMEHTRKACMVPLQAAWSDMGSWESFYETAGKDADGNAVLGDVVHFDNRNCYLHASHRLVAALGLDDISVVETSDAVLVLPRGRGQDVKPLLAELKKRRRPETETHTRVYRPWGAYEVLALGPRFQVKRIIVNPGGILSRQLHHHRSEHWVVVRGTAQVSIGAENLMLKEDEATDIPLGIRHRLENPCRIPLEIIEIQTGSYLGEDDIVRFEDSYGR